jgi:ribosomal protein S18 acetylase RimI-like enzyme
MKNVAISRAVMRDLDGLLKLEHECFEYDRIKPEEFKRLMRSWRTARVYVALHNDKLEAPCGYSIVQYHKTHARLYSIASSMRGVGRLLLQEAEKRAMYHRTEMRLEVDEENVRAIKFYRKAGYEQFGRYKNYYENGHAAFRFRKKLGEQPPWVT